MLFIDRDGGQPHAMPEVARQRLEVRNHQIYLPIRDQLLEPLCALCRLARCHQVLGQRTFIAHTIVYVSQTEAKYFSEVKPAKITQSPVEGCDVAYGLASEDG
jgi:hypothetical protein